MSLTDGVDPADVHTLYFTSYATVVHVNTLSDNISTSGRNTRPKGGQEERDLRLIVRDDCLLHEHLLPPD